MLEGQGSQVIQISLAHLGKCGLWGPAFNIISLPKIACKIVRPFKPDFRERWQVSEFSVSSRKTRSDQGKSRSRLNARDWRKFFLGLVSKPESKCQELSVSS